MDSLTVARALHVLAIVHWIGGVAMVTLVILPAVTRLAEPAQRLAVFEAVEGRFGAQARYSVTLAGLTGFYMTHELDGWGRFLDYANQNGEIISLKERLEHRKIIEQAKWVLVKRKNIDEPDAMRMLQRHARNNRRTLVDVAKAVLENDQLFSEA